MRAILVERELSCYAFFKPALQRIVKVRTADSQNQPVGWEREF
jgi:hypothetical protein